MDVVALSRVSSQLLKGVRAATHLESYTLGELHTWRANGCCCIEQGV